MRYATTAIATALIVTFASACTTESPMDPSEGPGSEVGVETSAVTTPVATDRVAGDDVTSQARRGGGGISIVAVDNNLPGGACPPGFRQSIAKRGHPADRNGDGLICQKKVGKKKRR